MTTYTIPVQSTDGPADFIVDAHDFGTAYLAARATFGAESVDHVPPPRRPFNRGTADFFATSEAEAQRVAEETARGWNPNDFDGQSDADEALEPR